MKPIKLNLKGLSAIEFLVGLLVASIIAVVVLTSIRSMRAEKRDQESKRDINTLAFELESFYQKNNYYPNAVNASTLANTDQEVFKDSRGKVIGEDSTLYTFTPINCIDTQCKSFELKAELEQEAPFIKQSLNN